MLTCEAFTYRILREKTSMQMKRAAAPVVLTAIVTICGCGGAPPKGNVTEAERIAAQAKAAGPMQW